MTARTRRRNWAIALAVVLLSVLAALAWRKKASADDGWAQASAPASAVPRGTAVLARVLSTPAFSASQPTARMAGSAPVRDERAEVAGRMKADWCGFSAAEQQRLLKLTAAADPAASEPAKDALAELNESVSAEVLEEARAQVSQRWKRALVQRGDPRSQALADYLVPDDGAPARLQARARTSGDPFVTKLALLRPCAAGACVNVEASQWSRLDPANLQAWLALLNAPGASRTQQGYVLERAASQVRYSRNYQQELTLLLLSLPQTESPGLQAQAEIELIDGIAAGWPIQDMRPMMNSCRGGLVEPGVETRCGAVADTLWQQGDWLDRAIAIGLVRAAQAGGPGLRPAWEARGRQYEAASEWNKDAFPRVMKRLAVDDDHLLPACLRQPIFRQMQQEKVALNDWERARMEMRDAGADEAELAARWRRQQGRSALDSVPRPASAATR